MNPWHRKSDGRFCFAWEAAQLNWSREEWDHLARKALEKELAERGETTEDKSEKWVRAKLDEYGQKAWLSKAMAKQESVRAGMRDYIAQGAEVKTFIDQETLRATYAIIPTNAVLNAMILGAHETVNPRMSKYRIAGHAKDEFLAYNTKTGHMMETGYMIPIPGREKSIPLSEDVDGRDVKNMVRQMGTYREHCRAYIQEHAGELAANDVYLVSTYDLDAGEIVLSLAHRSTTREVAEARAKEAGVEMRETHFLSGKDRDWKGRLKRDEDGKARFTKNGGGRGLTSKVEQYENDNVAPARYEKDFKGHRYDPAGNLWDNRFAPDLTPNAEAKGEGVFKDWTKVIDKQFNTQELKKGKPKHMSGQATRRPESRPKHMAQTQPGRHTPEAQEAREERERQEFIANLRQNDALEKAKEYGFIDEQGNHHLPADEIVLRVQMIEKLEKDVARSKAEKAKAEAEAKAGAKA